MSFVAKMFKQPQVDLSGYAQQIANQSARIDALSQQQQTQAATVAAASSRADEATAAQKRVRARRGLLAFTEDNTETFGGSSA